jgi:hypothetical protein
MRKTGTKSTRRDAQTLTNEWKQSARVSLTPPESSRGRRTTTSTISSNHPRGVVILSLCVFPKEPRIRRPAAMQIQESATLNDGQAYSLM